MPSFEPWQAAWGTRRGMVWFHAVHHPPAAMLGPGPKSTGPFFGKHLKT